VVEKTEVNSRGGVVGGKVLTRLECSLAYHARYVVLNRLYCGCDE